jgi:ATP-dependent Clp protease protease subunit
MSAAAYIYIAGHKRFMFDKSYFLFHQGSGSVSGSYSEVDSQMEDYKKKIAALTELMKKYTKYQEKEIAKNIKKEWYVSSKEAVENGVCDKMIESLDELIF